MHANKLAEKAVDDNLTDLEAKHPKLRRREEKEELEECLVSLEPGSGKIRAMIGGRNYQRSQFNRVTQSKRQPGSAFKIVTYAAAFDETLSGGPEKFLPTSYVDDTQWTWNYADNMSWTPNNYKDRYFGHVPLEFALEESLNAAAARIALYHRTRSRGRDGQEARLWRSADVPVPSYSAASRSRRCSSPRRIRSSPATAWTCIPTR